MFIVLSSADFSRWDRNASNTMRCCYLDARKFLNAVRVLGTQEKSRVASNLGRSRGTIVIVALLAKRSVTKVEGPPQNKPVWRPGWLFTC